MFWPRVLKLYVLKTGSREEKTGNGRFAFPCGQQIRPFLKNEDVITLLNVNVNMCVKAGEGILLAIYIAYTYVTSLLQTARFDNEILSLALLSQWLQSTHHQT